ncbi:bZIP transcription factor TGA10-like isoform X1 [Zingiber officinale]|uniref:bZIP transcription factor TGA10-like isoform X1 n=2 Tax=Zingiber officinale TaxID=94328 RepID=UPI001C4AF8F8|nr:bZIP transcription factor TGA10-like isoform X1 [Zingiber officinale]
MADEAAEAIHSGNQPRDRQDMSFPFVTDLPSSSSSSSQSMHRSFFMYSINCFFPLKSKEIGPYDLGELDQALFMYLDGQDHSASPQEQRQTLNIFPSQPMHVQPSTKVGIGSQKPSEFTMNSTIKDAPPSAVVKKEGGRKGTSTGPEHEEGPKTPDPKILRRLAQNREAARKSRLRKKAYIQQLENSRIKLTQLEHELQRARTQGLLLGGGAAVLGDQGFPTTISGLSSVAAMFDMEHMRWLEEQHRVMCELRAAVQEHLPETDLQIFVDSCLAHLDQLTQLKFLVIKSDVFHLISGTWLTPAERCFMWIAGFRPSDLIKMVLRHIEPLTEQQIVGVCALQQSAQETEEALSHGLEALNQSVSAAIAADALSCSSLNVADYMGQMAVAMDKLAAMEGFVRQAENLRQQTLQRLQQMLTTAQMARSLLAIAEYFHRLRALSSLWLSRPRQQDFNS